MTSQGGVGGGAEEWWTFDMEVPPSVRIEFFETLLRVANEAGPDNALVAFTCRFHVFERIHEMDPDSRREGVREFKTALCSRLLEHHKANDQKETPRLSATAVSLTRLYFLKYVESYPADRDPRELLQTATALYGLLEHHKANDQKVFEGLVRAKQKLVEHKYIPFNILPLDRSGYHYPFSSNQLTMTIPEIRAAVFALRNTDRLPWPTDYNKDGNDILDWLKAVFGFQKDNVANQREHLILLLANLHIRQIPKPDQKPDQIPELDDRALDELMEKLLKNYKKWCTDLNRPASLRLPTIPSQVQQQKKLLYVCLYLLVWGEASNLRFMPECLCYIYHHMASDMDGTLAGNPMTGENVKPADEEAFLSEVVSPIYEVIAKEAAWSKEGKAKHSQWRNYDDLNEYFWSVDCFQLGWPMRPDAEFFKLRESENNGDGKIVGGNRRAAKVNFVEIRSYWNVFRSFDRMWSFFILCLQVMILVAWNGDGNLTKMFDSDLFKKVLSVFITSSILNLAQAVLDVPFNWNARHCMSFYVKLRHFLKVTLAAAWAVMLPVTYAQTTKGLFGNSSSFIVAVFVYSSPNIVAAVLFLFPFIQHYFESSDYRVVMLMRWWSQPRLYVGRGMQESIFSRFKYMMFWILLIVTKLAFSYYIEIKPLVSPTKALMCVHIDTEVFPQARNNIGVVVTLWAPIILVYFMDTQIWYAVFSTLFGGIYGAVRRLGEIQTLEMLRSRFDSLHGLFLSRLIPPEESDQVLQPPLHKEKEAAIFAQLWNEIITSFREEDLINNWERELLLAPYWADTDLNLIQWPLFLLASKIPIALDMVKHCNGEYQELKCRIENDKYMSCAVCESYILFRSVIKSLVHGRLEKEVINKIFAEVDDHIRNGNLVEELKISALPILYDRAVELINYLLSSKKKDYDQVVILLLDMYKVVTRDVMGKDQFLVYMGHGDGEQRKYDLFGSEGAIQFPIPLLPTDPLTEKIDRLYLLLTMNESAVDVPSNSEARRRISFFSNSLFMDMPQAPEVCHMLSFSVLTPYYAEEVLFSLDDLEVPNEDGVSILFYLQSVFPDEWNNFLERMNCHNEDDLNLNKFKDDVCLWASYRGQTLTKTVRGMMYYRKALELQAFLDIAKDRGLDLMKGSFKYQRQQKDQLSWVKCEALADIKFTYVISCQKYGTQKQSGDPRARNVSRLMTEYPSLRVAYIDEVEEPSKDASEKVNRKVYYSVLVKAMPKGNDFVGLDIDQVIYKIKLPGPAILGEGKPENQNHAIIFTRGECLQTIDMNQDNYMEEALKMRNLLQEFLQKHDDVRYPTILGLREHIFTGSVSSLAWFMSNQEMAFVTIGQRFLANPLKVRFHYGHPDIFDRLFHLTRGGVSKASKIINLSEDIFAGFNSTLREGNVTHHEYIQVGKGRDVGFNQISLFEAKIANGNGEQTLSRDLYRLGHCFDFFRMLSCYFTTIGFYFSTLITVLAIYTFLYGRLYLVLSGLEEGLASQPASKHNESLKVALASQPLVQIGILLALPMMMEIALERGFWTLLSDFILMQIQLAPVFFTFSLGTKTHYYGRTLLHGGAKYRATGRGFVVSRAKFAEIYRLYSRSHFIKAIELLILLLVYQICGQSYRGKTDYFLITGATWFMVGTWLFAPFVFNPSGFEWQKIVDDWSDWNKWINNKGGFRVPPEKCWESWWEEEQEHLRYSGKLGVIAEILLSLRFFIYQYGLIYHLSFTKHHKSILVYVISWVVIFAILLVVKAVSIWRMKTREKLQVVFRLITAIFIMFISILVIFNMTFKDFVFCILAVVTTGWGSLLIAQACKPAVKSAGFRRSIRTLARGYEIVMGLLVFTPVAFLGWFPFVSEFQTRMLFNQAFSRGLQISRILGGHRTKRRSARKKK